MRSSTKIRLFILTALLIFSVAQTNFFRDFSSITGSTIVKDIPYEEGEFSLYFCPYDDCEKIMLDFIRNSKEIKCAFYDLDLESLKEALSEDDVLVFEDNYEGFGKPVESRGLMHNKFCISDENHMVMTGSTNPTENGVKKNNNNLFIIESPNLYTNYLEEYNELAGIAPERGVNYPKINHAGFIIENYFCPEDDCEEQVLEEIRKAEDSVHFMTFSFTSDPIGKLLVEKKDLDIKGVFEKRQQSQYSEYERLKEAGIEVKYDSNPATMHHKVFIIDSKTAIIGSYNPTSNANNRNDENILIIHNSEIAGLLELEFKRIYQLEE